MTFYAFDHKSSKRNTSEWTLVRLNRYRRPLIVALCFVAFLVYWYHSGHASLRSIHNTAIQAGSDPYAIRDHRISHEELHRKYREQLAAAAAAAAQLRPEEVVKDSSREEHPQVQGQDDPGKAPVKPGQDEADNGEKGDAVNVVKENKKPAAEPDSDSEEIENLPKGPVNVQAELDPDHQKAPLLSSPHTPTKEKVIEAESDAHLILEETADSLPEIIHIPFEDVVNDMKLTGWENDWIAHASYDSAKWGKLEEPKIDFIYLWVNGSEEAFQTTKYPYELNSVLNDPEGVWLSSHGVNRYRDWDELKYSVRSIEKYASSFRNKIQILVNDVVGTEAGKQIPTWLKNDEETSEVVQVLSQSEIFDDDKHICLPTFNSLTMENQLFNTPSNTDYVSIAIPDGVTSLTTIQVYALSDDMLLGKPHSASDIHSPLFGPVMGFKTNAYNTINPPTDADAARFGEKPFLIYTSWLLNRRFGIRKRKGQGHFGHALSRTVMREAIGSFPGPELHSACKRFRGEPGFQLYSWYATFYYLIERHREAMLWSYIMLRSDENGDGFLNWSERQQIMSELEAGMENEGKASFRKRNFYHVIQKLESAGLEGPQVNTDVLWTSLDGPWSILNLDCSEFDVNECLAPGFSISNTDTTARNPMFSSAVIFDRLARQKPTCGDCLLKLLLEQVPQGLSPILPYEDTQAKEREIVVKALMKYRYTISNPDALFVMVTDADQVDSTLTGKYVRGKKQLAGQLCLNDDVAAEDDQELQDVKQAMTELYQGLFPEKSPYEK